MLRAKFWATTLALRNSATYLASDPSLVLESDIIFIGRTRSYACDTNIGNLKAVVLLIVLKRPWDGQLPDGARAFSAIARGRCYSIHFFLL